MLTRIMRGGLLVLVGASVACSADGETAAGEANQTEGAAAAPLMVVRGREYGRCWFDVAADAAQLSCTTTARGSDPLGANVKVTVASVSSGAFTPMSKDLDVDAGGMVVVGSLPRSAFPAMIMLNAQLTREGIGWSRSTALAMTR